MEQPSSIRTAVSIVEVLALMLVGAVVTLEFVVTPVGRRHTLQLAEAHEHRLVTLAHVQVHGQGCSENGGIIFFLHFRKEPISSSVIYSNY